MVRPRVMNQYVYGVAPTLLLGSHCSQTPWILLSDVSCPEVASGLARDYSERAMRHLDFPPKLLNLSRLFPFARTAD